MANPNRTTARWRAGKTAALAPMTAPAAKAKRATTIEMPIELANALMVRISETRALLARLPAMYSTAEMVALDTERTNHSQFFEMFFHCTDLQQDAQAAADHMNKLHRDAVRISELVHQARS